MPAPAAGREEHRSDVHALLADGATVLIRPTTPDDLPAVRALFDGLSPESVRLRFFASGPKSGRNAAERLCRPDPDRIALLAIACRAAGEEVIGEAEAWRAHDSVTAEVGFTVAEGSRGRGVGTLLLEHLADAARARGIKRFVAETSSSNLAMKRVIASAGLKHESEFEHGGVVFHDIALDPDEAFLEVVADREFGASAASLDPLFRPRAVAVVGAGRAPGGIGRAVLDHIVASGFAGRVFAVNPDADDIAGVPCARSVGMLPQPIDSAVIAEPREQVVQAAIDCGRQGVKVLIVVASSVPASTTEVLKAVCRRYGMRLVGPDSLGAASFASGLAVDATFGAHTPLGGSAGVAVQSGGVGVAILEHLTALGIGVSSFVSLGDKADVSGNDLLAWWSADPATKLVLLHLESFGNPRKFARYARRVARTKPVLIVDAGRAAAEPRTAAAVTPAITRQALFRQAGVIATRSITELVQTAALLAEQPLPSGRRVAIVSNAGGVGALAADAFSEAGLIVAETDAGADADAADLRRAVEAVCASGNADAVVVLPVPTALADPRAVFADGLAHGRTPVLAVHVDQSSDVGYIGAGGDKLVPVFSDVADAARALAHAASYHEWLRRPEAEVCDLRRIRPEDAARIISLYMDAHPDGGWLPPDRAADLLACYGIDCAPLVLALNERTAVTAASMWRGPVALKAYWPELLHKSDVDGVLLGLAGEADVRSGWRVLNRRFGEKLAGVVVQQMAPRGVELLVGVESDPTFGPLVGVGVGGTDADLIGARRFALAPLTDLDAARLVDEPGCARLLAGYRGRPGGDVAAVREVLRRLSRLATEQPCVAEAEINPLIAGPDGAVAADFRVRVEPCREQDPYLRRLR